jgi:heptosyltransferase II
MGGLGADSYGRGILFVYWDGLNPFYIRKEEPQLREAFAYPPNVLDNFVVYAADQVRRSIPS